MYGMVYCDYVCLYDKVRTDSGVCKDDKETCVVYPLDLEPAARVLPLRKGGMDIASFKLFWEAS
jgi:hypothetical protein